jgi:hypothetical protein
MTIDKIDYRWLVWEGLKERYLFDGDISEIAELVRVAGVPSGWGISEDIADILTGRLKPNKQPNLAMQFAEKALKAQADDFKRGPHIAFNKAMADLIRLRHIKPFKAILSDTNIRKMIAHKYYRGDLENARQVVYRAKKKLKNKSVTKPD